jgi:hypothetical protein
MAIDKIKLRYLAKDKDVRLFEEGDMLDALNITVDANSESSGDLVKNVKSTLRGTAATSSDQLPIENCRVVGSVSDDANGKVYFFVWSATASNHGIYQYNAVLNTYKVVLKSSVLGFSEYGFVKADLINGEFQKDEVSQTIVYFTDGVKPPRKINVDRAFATVLGNYSNRELEEFLSVIKSPSLFPPTVSLATDTSRKRNNLYGSVYQFAVQYVYKDGESSALSPHSKVVYPRYMSLQGVVDADIDADDVNAENVAFVNTKWRDLPPTLDEFRKEVSKIRILGRTLNSNPFFIVDEFDPNIDVVRNGTTLYSTSSGVYKFYNDGLYLYEQPNVTDKVYDDVPQTAVGQTIAGNRLMYSNVKAGYPNVNARATLTVAYAQEPSVSLITSLTSSDFLTHVQNVGGGTEYLNGYLKFDFNGLFPNSATTIAAGLQVKFSFEYLPTSFEQWGYYNQSGTIDDGPVLTVNWEDEDGVTQNASIGQAENSQGITNYSSTQGTFANPGNSRGAIHFNIDPSQQENTMSWQTLDVSFTTEEGMTKDDFMTKMRDLVIDKLLSYSFDSSVSNSTTDTITWQLRDNLSALAYELETQRLDFDIRFDVSHVDGVMRLDPVAGNFFIPSGNLADDGSSNLNAQVEKLRIRPTTSSPPYGGQYLSGVFNGLAQYSYFTSGTSAPRELNGIPMGGIDDAWSTYSYSYDGAVISNQKNGARIPSLSAIQAFSRRTFKSGCSHKFGIVYFDRHGRPGYVNDLGSVEVKPFGDSARTFEVGGVSTAHEGPCTISVDMLSSPPTWASTYQIVYSDMQTWEKFESFTVGGGWFKQVLEANSNTVYIADSKKIYVSLNTLTEFQTTKGALKNYAYTPGDKLRIVSYKDGTTTGLTYGQNLEFDVVGYETVVADLNGEPSTEFGHTNHVGKFLVLSPVGGQPVSNFDPGASEDFWHHEVLVEILTPRKTPPEEVFYEIGESRKILGPRELSDLSNNTHNDSTPISLTEGSVYYGARSVVVPPVLSVGNIPNTFWTFTNIELFVFGVRNIESMDASDFVPSRCWSKGRAHVKYDKAATINYYNRITYSEEYGDDIGDITFSSFNPGAFSYKNMPKRYGAINYIGNVNQSLVSLQENKLSLVPVNRNVIEYADSTSNVTASKEVLGTHQEANGDFGIGSDPSSALIRDGVVFFVDRSRQKIIASGGAEMKVISDIDMSSFFEAQMNSLASIANGGRIVSGFDPQEDMYYVTFEGVGTAGYSLPRKRWISRYSFTPSNYASIDNSMISGFKKAIGETPVNYLFHKHSAGSSRNNFYGVGYSSEVQVVSKISPSEVKVFNALSYEGNSDQWTVDDPVLTDLHQESGLISSFKEKEGAYYASMPRVVGNTKGLFPVNGAYDGGTSQYLLLGHVQSYETSGNGHIVTFDNRLSRIPMPSMSTGTPLVSYLHSGEIQGAVGLNSLGNAYMSSYDLENNTITISGSNVSPNQWSSLAFVDNAGNGQPLYLVLNAEANGDPIRGRWAKIRLTNDNAGPQELYCINTHISKSKTHHVLGQE